MSYYFKDKESLFWQVLESDMQQLIDMLSVAAHGDGTARDRLTAVADTFKQLMRDKRPLVQLSMRQFGEQGYEIHDLVRSYRQQLLQPLEQVLEAGVSSGELRTLNIPDTAMSFLVLVVRDLKDMRSSIPEADRVTQTVTLLFDGIRAR